MGGEHLVAHGSSLLDAVTPNGGLSDSGYPRDGQCRRGDRFARPGRPGPSTARIGAQRQHRSASRFGHGLQGQFDPKRAPSDVAGPEPNRLPRAMADTWEVPDPGSFDSLLDVLDDSATRWAGKRQFALRTDDGIELPWTAADLRYRSKLAAWRLRRLGLNPGIAC